MTVAMLCAAIQKFIADFHQRRSGEPDSFQSLREDAYKPITKAYTHLQAALQQEQSLTADQQVIIQAAVTTTHKQLEKFACCTSAPPFLVSPSGHWTQDSRLTAQYLKQLVSAYVYDPDQQSDKPFWQRILGFRKLLAVESDSTASQHMGRGRFWSSRSSSPPPAVPVSPAQQGTAGRPTLRRQNAFKLTEEESRALTQQLGINHAHSGSGHDLLAEPSDLEEVDDEASADHNPMQAESTAGASLNVILSGAKALSQGASFGEPAKPRTASEPAPDLHQPVNATTAYANVTRCNPKRWVAAHTSGGPYRSKPHVTCSCLWLHHALFVKHPAPMILLLMVCAQLDT